MKIKSTIQTVVPVLLLWVSGFFFAMLWFMLMADSRGADASSSILSEEVLAPIRTFYMVIFGPMTWLVKIVFGLGLLCMSLQLTIQVIPWYVRWAVFITNAPPILMAALYIIPMVNRLISNTASLEVQSEYVRTIHNAHILAASCVAFMIVTQTIVLIRLQRIGQLERSMP